MKSQSTFPVSTFEKTLIETIRNLQPRRAEQVLDFARWLKTQAESTTLVDEEISEEELEQEEKAWEQAYLENRNEFRAMAQEAIRDLEAGDTLEMVIENGKISPK